MRIPKKLNLLAVFLPLFLFTTMTFCFAGELIQPTRSLDGQGEASGRMAIFSEPPNLEVYLDGKKVGNTPLWLSEVKSGLHTVRIEKAETEANVRPGMGLKIGLFKGSFVSFPDKDQKAGLAPTPEKQRPQASQPSQTSGEKRQRDINSWELFVNGSQKFF